MKVYPMKGVSRFAREYKLSLRFNRPLKLINKLVKLLTIYYYMVIDMHDVFHVYVLRKWFTNINHIILEDKVGIRPNLAYSEKP